MKTKALLIILCIGIGATLFYWFEYRPSKIRSYCDWKAKSETSWNVTDSPSDYEAQYSSCLHNQGL